jgi:hypothetical protein
MQYDELMSTTIPGPDALLDALSALWMLPMPPLDERSTRLERTCGEALITSVLCKYELDRLPSGAYLAARNACLRANVYRHSCALISLN